MEYSQKQVEDLIRQRAEKEMSTEEIVRADVETNGRDDSPEIIIRQLKALGQRGAQFMRFGNTLIVVTSIVQGRVRFLVLNGDSPENFLVNIITFLAYIKEQGMQTAQAFVDEPQQLGLISDQGTFPFVSVQPNSRTGEGYEVNFDLLQMRSK